VNFRAGLEASEKSEVSVRTGTRTVIPKSYSSSPVTVLTELSDDVSTKIIEQPAVSVGVRS
jgi:hypothetical protein